MVHGLETLRKINRVGYVPGPDTTKPRRRKIPQEEIDRQRELSPRAVRDRINCPWPAQGLTWKHKPSAEGILR